VKALRANALAERWVRSVRNELVLAPGGREHRADEFRSLLAAAGLHLSRIISTEVPRSVIEAVPG
jgi:hypothetical protein